MNRKQETGPIDGVALIERLPVNGMLQEMPSRADLERAAEHSVRIVAGYEVLLSHFREALHLLRVVVDYGEPTQHNRHKERAEQAFERARKLLAEIEPHMGPRE